MSIRNHTLKFPVRKERASRSTESRRDRGANNKRLTCSESALVAFTAPIAGQKPEAHETSEPTRDGEGVPTVLPCGQLPGCLPNGYDLDSMLTPDQFCLWQGFTRAWFGTYKSSMPGVVSHTREMVRIHPRTYLEKSVKGK
jgi:hypothetical protein